MKLKQIFSRDLIILVLGQVISLFGNAIVRFALPLYLLRETNSPSLFGVVTACSFLPMVVFSFLGGGIADRVNKRNIMVALDFATSLLMVGLALALEVLPLVPLLIGVLMLLYGISGAYQPSVQASLPLLVPEEGLVQANALVNMVSTLAGLLGPVVGGVLFGAFGVYPIVLVSALCFFASAVMECFLRIPHNGRPRTDSLLRTVKGDLAESWRFMGREKPNFLRVTLLLALFNLVLSAAIIVGIPIMVVQLLHGSDTQLGLTQGALGLGGLMGGLLASGLGARLRLHHSPLLLLLASGGVVLMGVALLPLVSPIVGYGLITVLSFLVMGVSTLFTVTILAAMQGQTPPDLLGKVMATVLATANCAQPLGQAVYGLLFEGLADHAWAVMLGAGLLAACLALRARPVFWALEKETDRSAGDATVR